MGFTNPAGMAIDGGGVLQTNLDLNSKNLTNGGDISGANANAYILRNVASSNTVPSVCPNRVSNTYGLGATAATAVYMVVGGTNTMQFGTAVTVSDQDFNYRGSDADRAGAQMDFKVNAVPSGALSGATFDFAAAIPAGAVVIGTAARVTTLITGCTTWDFGVVGATTRYGTGLALTAGTTADNTNWLAGTTALGYQAATAIRLTAVGGGATFTAGAVRIIIYYFVPTAPTS